MTIPDYQTIMLPLLEFASDNHVHTVREAVNSLRNHFSLTEDELSDLLPSGRQTTFFNRVSWARTYLKHAGLLSYPKRGQLKITPKGEEVLRRKMERIDVKFLNQFPEFVEFRKRSRKTSEEENHDDSSDDLDPQETLEKAYLRIRSDLAGQLLENISSSSPEFFEQLVVELLVKMGYGGSHKDAARAVGKSGDEGIDGIIDEDRLGLDTIYIQAKRWKQEQTIGRPEIQKFVGALQGKRARKGVFITTSKFSNEAKDYVNLVNTKVVLIDGNKLADLMIDFGVGVSTTTTFEIKELNSDFFDEI